MKHTKGQISLFDYAVADCFAGGGGASLGIERALGHPVDIAINHNESAIMMHKRNHPFTEHYKEDIWMIDPETVVRGRHVRLAWFSPDCKHFSRASGKALKDRNIRGLAWVVLRWAAKVRPDVIMLENVPEFLTWGPVRKGKPVKKKAGQTFARWRQQLEDLGYKIEWRLLCAADYGAPTIRKRLCLVARCDGRPIVFPEPTHAPRNSEAVKNGRLKPWRAAAECIDWSLPCYSIFESKEEIKEKYGAKVLRPLADNTMKRIAQGLDKFVIKSAEPFIIPVGYGEKKGQKPRTHDAKQPFPTVVGTVKHHLCDPVVQPYIVCNNNNNQPHGTTEPMPTITTGNRNLLCAPTISPFSVECNHAGGGHVNDLRNPHNTVTTKCTSGIVAPFIQQYHESKDARGQTLDKPLLTVDAGNRYAMTAAYLAEWYGNAQDGIDPAEPMRTVMARDREGIVCAAVSKYFSGAEGASLRDPLPTVTGIDHNALMLSHLSHFKGADKGQDAREPLMSITAADGQFGQIRTTVVRYQDGAQLGHWAEVRAMLNRYCGYSLGEDEILLLDIFGVLWFISDVGLRMFCPRELYRAMGFPDDYIIDRDVSGNPISREDQVARCGNAVCPALSEAMVRANLPEECTKKSAETMEELIDQMVS